MEPSSATNSVNRTASLVPGEVFKCRHCKKSFRNGQALGGHQNAHRAVHRGVMRRIADAMGSLRRPAAAPARQPAVGPSSFEPGEVNQAVHLIRTTEPENPPEGKTRMLLQEWRNKDHSDSERTVSESVVPKRSCYTRRGEDVPSATHNIDLDLKLGL